MAAEADTQIFTVCVYDRPQTQEEMEGPALLGQLAQASGGVKYVISDVKELRKSLGQIAVNLHNQYVLGYYPPDQAQSGKYRKIQVQVLLPQGPAGFESLRALRDITCRRNSSCGRTSSVRAMNKRAC